VTGQKNETHPTEEEKRERRKQAEAEASDAPLSPSALEDKKQMRLAREAMERFRNALRELAG